MTPREKVFIGRVETYDHAAIRDTIARGIAAVGGKVPTNLVGKPNWVCAHHKVAAHCYTRPEHLRGAIEALFEKNGRATIALAGNSGAGVPTKVMAKRATGEAREFRRRGALALESIFPGRVTIAPSDGDKHYIYDLERGETLSEDERRGTGEGVDPQKRYWRSVKTSARLFDCEGLVFFPKLKSNVLAHGVTGAIKLQGIGFLLDEARMDGHNYHNHRRIVDLLEVAEPDLIITDGIEIALGGNQMTERGYRLGVVLVATNAVAHDATCARILGLHPERVDHIRIAHERGYGPIFADEIEIVGDAQPGELAARVRHMNDTGFIPVVDFPQKFKRETYHDFPAEILGAPPWDVAGVHGVVLDWLYMTYDFADTRKKMADWPHFSVIVGGFKGAAPVPRWDRVYVIGDRAIEAWERLNWANWGITIPRLLRRYLRLPARLERYRRPDGRHGLAVLVKGDPPTHRDLIMAFAATTRFRVRPPLLRFDLALDSFVKAFATYFRRWWRNRGGVKRVSAGEIARLRDRKEARRAMLPPPAPAVPFVEAADGAERRI